MRYSWGSFAIFVPLQFIEGHNLYKSSTEFIRLCLGDFRYSKASWGTIRLSKDIIGMYFGVNCMGFIRQKKNPAPLNFIRKGE